MLNLLLLLLAPTLLVADAKDPSKKPANEKGLKILARTQWFVGGRPGAKPQQIVIRSVEELQKSVQLRVKDIPGFIAKRFNVPKIDFDKHMIIVATAGAKRTGGYSVQITDLPITNDTLTVKWKLNAPPPGSFVTQAFTHPSQAVLVPKFKGKVVFDPKK